MAKLTKRAIDGFEYAGGWDVRWDAEVPGFGLRIYPTGKKAFVLSYRAQGRKRLMVLGRYGADLTLGQARDKARKERVKVKEGADPIEDARKATQGETVEHLIDRYIEAHAKPHKKSWARDRDRLDRHIPTTWRNRKARAITHDDVAGLHAKIGEQHPYEANRLLALLRVMFRLGRKWRYLEPGADNPAEGVTKFKERSRKRFAQPHELPLIAEAIDGESSIYVRSVIWCYMLTGARKAELLPRRWDEIDWPGARIRLPDTKGGEEQSIPLSAPALAILQAVPRQEKHPYIFCGAKPRKPMVNIDKPWRRIRERATVRFWTLYEADPNVPKLVERLSGELVREPTYMECQDAADADEIELPSGLQDLRLHDLRRSVGSWMTADDINLNRIKDALRHANIATTLTYARLGEDASREAFERHGQRIMEAAGKAGPVGVPGGSD